MVKVILSDSQSPGEVGFLDLFCLWYWTSCLFIRIKELYYFVSLCSADLKITLSDSQSPGEVSFCWFA
jgi:hypothetical protein